MSASASSSATPLSALPAGATEDDEGDMGITVEEAMDLSEEESEGSDDDEDEPEGPNDGGAGGDGSGDVEMSTAGGQEQEHTPAEPAEPATPTSTDPRLRVAWDKDAGHGHDALGVGGGEPMVVS
jgi:hypothetical protein